MKKRKSGQTAAVATARKLCTVIWSMLDEQRVFEHRPHKDRASRSLTPNLSSSRLVEMDA